MQRPSSQEIGEWDRWFAAHFNNLAWTLPEKADPALAEAEEMLHLSHASALHWSRVGNEPNKMRADMLLAHVHALLGNDPLALSYARRFMNTFRPSQAPTGRWRWRRPSSRMRPLPRATGALRPRQGSGRGYRRRSRPDCFPTHLQPSTGAFRRAKGLTNRWSRLRDGVRPRLR
jgi:hypothetical protein